MIKRTFGLGALTMISACVSGGADPSDGGASRDATVTAPPPLPARDASSSDATIIIPPKDAGDPDPDTCALPIVVTQASLEQDPGWKPAKAPAPMCTTTEISQFEKNLQDTNLKTWAELATDLGPSCAGCIVTNDTETNWGPVVVDVASGGNKGFYNFGACFGQVESPACGKAVQFLEVCLDLVCDSCTTQGDRDACIEAASDTTGACSTFVDSLTKECKNLSASGKKCNNIRDAAKTLCGPNAGDAGASDAGDAGL